MSFFKSFVVATAAAATPVAAITAAPGDASQRGPLPMTATRAGWLQPLCGAVDGRRRLGDRSLQG